MILIHISHGHHIWLFKSLMIIFPFFFFNQKITGYPLSSTVFSFSVEISNTFCQLVNFTNQNQPIFLCVLFLVFPPFPNFVKVLSNMLAMLETRSTLWSLYSVCSLFYSLFCSSFCFVFFLHFFPSIPLSFSFHHLRHLSPPNNSLGMYYRTRKKNKMV